MQGSLEICFAAILVLCCLSGSQVGGSSLQDCEDSCGKDDVCRSYCKVQNGINFSVRRNLPVGELLLLCREENALVITWHEWSNQSHMLVLEMKDKLQKWEKVDVEKIPLKRLEQLKPNKGYYFRLSLFSNDVYYHFEPKLFKTLKGDVNPKNIIEWNVTFGTTKDNFPIVKLVWKPNEDLICKYELLIYGQQEIPPHEVVKYEELYEMELTGLEFSKSYKVTITSKYSSTESERNKTLNFKVPSCLELNNSDLNICVPDSPNNLKAEDFTENCTVIISWSHPSIQPHSYFMRIRNSIGTSSEEINYNISGNENKFETSLNSLKGNYLISLSAVGPSGQSYPKKVFKKNPCYQDNILSPMASPRREPESKTRIQSIILISVIVLVAIVLTATSIVYIVLTKKRKMKTEAKVVSKQEDINKNWESVESLEDEENEEDEGDIKPKMLEICGILGEGEFGIVRKAIYTSKFGEKLEVAVKMLRENNSVEDQQYLQKEIDVMRSVGKHKHIVSLLGFSTAHKILVVEFCSLGDLQNYLRQAWKTILAAQEELNLNSIDRKKPSSLNTNKNCCYESVSDMHGPNIVSNILYEKTDIEKKHLGLRMMDLLSFARQVALGMEFLSENHVIHRDLATRNVLLCDDMTVKISDFGLSRDVYEQNIYWKKSSGRLPLKWMALESLFHQVFTTQSDVWSFGVLLWELMTLGGCPYPSVPCRQMFKLLQEGYRMEKPPTCTEEVYNIMMMCWDAKPNKRPSFTSLVCMLEEIMKSESPHKYLNLKAIPNDYINMWYEEEERENKSEN